MTSKLYDFKDHPEHQKMLAPWRDRWIANAMSTKAMDDAERALCIEAVYGLYKAAKLPAPKHIVFVPSPFVLAFAGGFSSAIWHASRAGSPTGVATEAATRDATRVATRAATGAATWVATAAATEAAKEAAPAEGAPDDNLWPGQALETGTVRADGTWGAYHWRSADPGQRFTGQCWVETRGLSQGWAQIGLEFANGYGTILGHSQPAGTGMPDGVSAPAPGRTLLRLTGTAPAGADRVALCLLVVRGTPGAEVTFDQVLFHRLP